VSEPVLESEPEIVIVPDRDAGAVEAAARVAAILAGAMTSRARADWATTGGSTPIGIYRRLILPPLADGVPWAEIHVWWGDDRFVPRDHPLSNVKPLDDILVGIARGEEGTAGGRPGGVALRVGNLHPFRTGEAIAEGRDAAWCAAALADELRAAGLASADGWPVFDLVLVGIGADGHLLSVFPGSTAFDSTELAMAIPAPTHIEPHVERVTLNPAVLRAARQVLVVAYGSDKAPVLGQIFGSERDPRRWPAQLARRSGATWVLDEAAAANLPH
jgi:6-phosphogluconolactonase